MWDILGIIVNVLTDTFKIKSKTKKDAKLFCNDSDNDSNMDFLPLCMVALSINTMDLTGVHGSKFSPRPNRSIYTNFINQDEMVQKVILKKNGIIASLPSDPKWVIDYLNMLFKDASDKNWTHPDLYTYDDFKYYHKGLSDYCNVRLDDDSYLYRIPNEMFNVDASPTINIISKSSSGFSFSDYIDEFVRLVNPNYDSFLKKECERVYPIALASTLANKHGYKTNQIMSYYLMTFVKEISEHIQKEKYGSVVAFNGLSSISTDRELEYYGELYYESLLQLYIAYAPKRKVMKLLKKGK